MDRHATIPVFVTHAACPNLCVFCNQKKIGGKEITLPELSDYLRSAVEELSDRFTSCDIAFFGGSFTGIEPSRMTAFLSEAYRYLGKGKITGIRLSTRPDYISEEILDLLAAYGVTDIELGIQSLDDGVLSASKRGHTCEASYRAVESIRARKCFRLVLQLMPGLPGDTPETIRETFRKALELHPDGVRIYPTVVIADTELEKMYLDGCYQPLSLEDAVQLTAEAALAFRKAGISILRMGLHSSDLSQNNGVIAGPYHPAFGELVEGRLCLWQMREQLRKEDLRKGGEFVFRVEPREISRMVGQKRINIRTLEEEFGIRIRVTGRSSEPEEVRPVSCLWENSPL